MTPAGAVAGLAIGAAGGFAAASSSAAKEKQEGAQSPARPPCVTWPRAPLCAHGTFFTRLHLAAADKAAADAAQLNKQLEGANARFVESLSLSNCGLLQPLWPCSVVPHVIC